MITRALRKPLIPIYTAQCTVRRFRRFFLTSTKYVCPILAEQHMHTYWSIIRYRGDRASKGEDRKRDRSRQTSNQKGGGGGGGGEDNWTCVWSPFYSVEDDSAKMSLFCVGHTVTTYNRGWSTCVSYMVLWEVVDPVPDSPGSVKNWVVRHVQAADPDPVGDTMVWKNGLNNLNFLALLLFFSYE
jgi:hypothetical protein